MHWYTGNTTYDTLLTIALGFAVFVFAVSWVLPSPYGRFATSKYGISIDPRWGWFLMELPATLSFLWFFCHGPHRDEAVPRVFLAMWLLHYLNRGFLFPLLMRVPKGSTGSFSALVIVTGWGVTSLHGYFHAAYFTSYGTHYGTSWFYDPRFLVGLVVYYVCMGFNVHADAIVRNLRSREEVAAGTRVYRIPYGGLFRFVSSPSYFAELVAWAAFAVCTWSLAGLFILLISIANLVPRAASTQKWYRERFPDYPLERKALIPFIW
jgi:3-oxo-5-alpha-steroid 4-dehydrogenase 1